MLKRYAENLGLNTVVYGKESQNAFKVQILCLNGVWFLLSCEWVTSDNVN